MMKKIFIIAGAAIAAMLGAFGFVKNSKKLKMRRVIKRVSSTMYTVGTMMRMLSLQVAKKPSV